MKAVLRKIRISPKKANLVAGTVRGKNVKEALSILKFMPKKGADIIYKIVHSAAHNAKNNFKQNIDDLIITKLLVTKGPTYKRSLPISRGRTHPIMKRTSHITVEVGMPEESVLSKTEELTPSKSKKSVSSKKDVKVKEVSKKVTNKSTKKKSEDKKSEDKK